MPRKSARDTRLARQGRRAGLLMAASMLIWLGAQLLGGRLGWDPRAAFAFDLLAMAGLLVALWMTFQVYRARQAERPDNRRQK